MNFEWRCSFKDVTSRKVLESLLPEEFDYQVNEFNILNVSQKASENQFKASLEINTRTKEEILNFIESFELKTNTYYNLTNHSDKENQKFLAFSGARKCVHRVQKIGTKKDQSAGKNTECPSKITFKIRKSNKNDSLLPLRYPTLVSIDYVHNHSVESAAAYKFHKIKSSTKEKYQILFQAGHTASSAHRTYKAELQREYSKTEFIKMSADRSIVPESRWVYYAYDQYVKTNFGHINSPEAYRLAEERCKEYNQKNGENLASIHKTEDGHYYVIICDSFSRRVHEVILILGDIIVSFKIIFQVLPAAGDIVFVDSTSSLDRSDTKLFREAVTENLCFLLILCI